MGHITKFILIFFSLLLFSCGKNESVQISGIVENLDGTEILVSFFSSDSIVIDTIFIKQKGRFSYNNDVITDLTSLTFYFNEQTSHVLVFASPGDKIKMKGDVLLPELMQVRGNSINNELTYFKEENQDLLEHRILLRNNLRQQLDSIETGNLLSLKEEMSKLSIINNELIHNAEEFIENYPDRMSSLIIVNEFFTTSDNENGLGRIMELLSPELLKTEMGLNFENYLKKIRRSAEGSVMPFFEVENIDGDTINSYDYRGKQLLLSFITSEESESQIALSLLRDVYEKVDKDSVEFLSVYVDTAIHSDTIYKQDSLKWDYHVADRSWASDIVSNYNVEFVPSIFLITPDGIISNRNLSLLSIEEKLKIK